MQVSFVKKLQIQIVTAMKIQRVNWYQPQDYHLPLIVNFDWLVEKMAIWELFPNNIISMRNGPLF